MGLPDLYPAQVGSPYTTLAAPYTTGEATMTVVDATKLPDAPNIVCLAGSVAGEFRYSGKGWQHPAGSCHALPGTPNATWPAGTYAFRGIAAYDTNALQTRSMFATAPDLPNRVVYETDEAGNTLEIHQVYIPLFYGDGLPDANLNGVLFGGFWIDKYLACQPDASNVSRGSVSPNNPGTNGAASKPHVVPWTDINWGNAKRAIENRGGAANRKSGTCTPLAEASASKFYVADVTHLIGKRVYVTQAGVRYVRRVVRTGGDTTADPNAAKLLELYPALPAPITDADTYEILHYYLPGGYEWMSLYAWAYMNLYRHGLGWPKGNTNWGKFHGDPRERAYEGLPDPVRPGYGGNAIARTLTGSGPLSWSLNGKESGIWDLVGNCWEWCDLLVGTVADNTVDAEYPGAGTRLPTSNGTSRHCMLPNLTASIRSAPRYLSLQRSGRRKRTMTGRTTGRIQVSVPRTGREFQRWRLLLVGGSGPELDAPSITRHEHRLPRSLLIWSEAKP
jgi:hypothetical protein